MTKLLLLLVLVLVVVGWLAIGRRRKPAKPPEPASAPPGPAPAATPKAMLACAHCGVHLPAADALRDAGARAFCTEAHRLAGPRDRAS